MTEKMLQNMYSMQVDEYLGKHLFQNPRYQSLKRLNKFEFQAFSQHGEDGIIEEIFNRIGSTNKYFIEFGVENGTESNSTYLLFKGWQGLWIEGNPGHVSSIESSCKGLIEEKKLVVIHSFVKAGNIQVLFRQAGAPAEPDLLSIDIDRNDYHIWQAITDFHPRVVILEYNAIFRPGTAFVIKYDADASWDKSSNFGASLQSYYELGLEKGYALVCCDFTGTNAFFVRNDLIGQLFEPPFTPENYYEPPRYFLTKKDGHPRKLLF
ncbi:MAG TPA: hypothetical protein VL832_16820 [Puia sp.]|nr:hypothetical protein [Puia sp.]